MAGLQFSDNFNDLSVNHGANAGFQFEFHCEVCGDRTRSDFVAYTGGRASSWFGKATDLLGGMLGKVGDAAETLAAAGYGRARDKALADAIETMKAHFHRCARCHQQVCHKCWNRGAGLCTNCAPDAEVEIEAARASGRASGAGENAALAGVREGKKMDVKRERQLVCPQCNAETHGAKFCPECGAALAVKNTCPKCQATLQPGVKFCPECGNKVIE